MAPAGDDGDGLSVTALSGADDGEPGRSAEPVE